MTRIATTRTLAVACAVSAEMPSRASLVEMHGESPRPVEERGRRRDDVKTHRRPSPRLARQITCRYIVMASQPSIAESLRSERPSHGQEDETAMRPRRDREVGEETRHL